MKDLGKSFVYAFNGFIYCLKNERNMRIHLTIAVYMYFFIFAFDFFTITRTELALLFISNAFVFMGELINTAIESTIDLLEKRYDKLAKIAKDTAAAAVLSAAVFSVGVGIAVLWQPDAFSEMFEYFKTHIPAIIILVITLVLAVMFIFKKGKSEKSK